ncbi:flippase [Yoonia sp.]|uniref:flippase n=1 Tax=Yoonia sp. TaxID=2212373 RepID=UPI00358FC257
MMVTIFSNIGWLFFDKIYRLGGTLLINITIARQFGPEGYGLLSLALALVEVGAAITLLGLRNIVVNDIVTGRTDAKRLVGTSMVLVLASGLTVYFLLLLTTRHFWHEDSSVLLFVAILGSSLVHKFLEVTSFWFEALTRSKFVVITYNTVFSVFLCIKIFLLLTNATLLSLVIITAVEMLAISLGLAVVFQKKGLAWQNLSFASLEARNLLSRSWPLLLTAFAIMIYMRVDQIMISRLLSTTEVGIYTAALSLSQLWYFFPSIVVASVFPTLIATRESDRTKYVANLQALYDFLTMVAFFVTVFTVAMADSIIDLVYGTPYEEAATVLSIHIFTCIFVSMGLARGRWLISEDLQFYSFIYTGIGLVVNIVLNAILIIPYGITGAAIATLISQMTVALFAPALFRSTRVSSKMLLASMNPIRWPSAVRHLRRLRSEAL